MYLAGSVSAQKLRRVGRDDTRSIADKVYSKAYECLQDGRWRQAFDGPLRERRLLITVRRDGEPLAHRRIPREQPADFAAEMLAAHRAHEARLATYEPSATLRKYAAKMAENVQKDMLRSAEESTWIRAADYALHEHIFAEQPVVDAELDEDDVIDDRDPGQRTAGDVVDAVAGDPVAAKIEREVLPGIRDDAERALIATALRYRQDKTWERTTRALNESGSRNRDGEEWKPAAVRQRMTRAIKRDPRLEQLKKLERRSADEIAAAERKKQRTADALTKLRDWLEQLDEQRYVLIWADRTHGLEEARDAAEHWLRRPVSEREIRDARQRAREKLGPEGWRALQRYPLQPPKRRLRPPPAQWPGS